MNISFENKVAVVTGAASGLGLATAKAFAEAGASVVLADWNERTCRPQQMTSRRTVTKHLPFYVTYRMTLRWKLWSSKPSPSLDGSMRRITMRGFRMFSPRLLTLLATTTTA
jgi:short chain dehydrogenase